MTKILLVGCGKMGGALLQGLGVEPSYEISVIDPAPEPSSSRFLWVASPDALPDDFSPDVVILAVKPQLMAAVLPAYARFPKALFLSIAAGQSLARMDELLGGTRTIVRAMPNLPASIGIGASVLVANGVVSDLQKQMAEKLMASIGTVDWVSDEPLIDAVTALSGSGPAYFFALVEAMAVAGETLGLPQDLARRLARQTLVGSGALLGSSEQSASDLRIAVTSPGGTTAAALTHLLAEDGLFQLLQRAMDAAALRARELSH